jgi:light-harvesting complex I chlorophyll a/b binding protein 5
MAAVAGILFTDLVGLPKWYEAGAMPYGIPPLALLAIQAPIMGFLETKRLEGFLATGKSGFLDSFPFDPMGQMSPTKELNEIKNGRLAMVAFAGFATQALVTRTGPLENLQAHLSNPFGNKCVSTARALYRALH